MKVIVCEESWDVDPDEKGGLIKELSEEFNEINLTKWVDQGCFNLYMQPDKWQQLPSDELVGVYKIAHYLNTESDMKTIGKEIAKRLSSSTYADIKNILKYFDIST